MKFLLHSPNVCHYLELILTTIFLTSLFLKVNAASTLLNNSTEDFNLFYNSSINVSVSNNSSLLHGNSYDAHTRNSSNKSENKSIFESNINNSSLRFSKVIDNIDLNTDTITPSQSSIPSQATIRNNSGRVARTSLPIYHETSVPIDESHAESSTVNSTIQAATTVALECNSFQNNQSNQSNIECQRLARRDAIARNENVVHQENKASRLPSPDSRVPLLEEFPATEKPALNEQSNQSSITNTELRAFIAQMRAGRAADVLFTEISGQDSCETSTGSTGSCVPLLECKIVLDNLARQRPTICQWINDMPVVCCPTPTLWRKFEEPDCGTRVIKGINRITRQAARTIPDSAIPLLRNKQPAIAGGIESTIGAWPWMAGIYTRNFGMENFLCGGTIINDRYIVTAAHCFRTSGGRNVQPTRYAVRVGSSNVREGTLYLVDSITIHPQYRPREHYNDIAVIKLKQKINFEPNVRPICLPTAQDIRRKRLQGRDVTVTGWGDQEFGGKSASVLREVTVQVVDVPTCDESYKDNRGLSLPRGITNQFICAGTPEGGKDACSRDSGGPLMLLEKGVYFLVGVVSFGFQCARPGYPGVYTRVTSYLDWLEENASNT